MSKLFALRASDIKPLAEGRGSCLASDRITIDGQKVGFMYRERSDTEVDSGWRFLAGDETDSYTADPSNFSLLDVNTVANYDPAIIPFLNALVGSAYSRSEAGDLVPANQ